MNHSMKLLRYNPDGSMVLTCPDCHYEITVQFEPRFHREVIHIGDETQLVTGLDGNLYAVPRHSHTFGGAIIPGLEIRMAAMVDGEPPLNLGDHGEGVGPLYPERNEDRERLAPFVAWLASRGGIDGQGRG